MSILANQMQGRMDAALTVKRIEPMISTVKGAMIDAANRIEKRPSFEGCDAFEQTSQHSMIKANNNDDSGFQMMQMAVCGGGIAEIAADVAIDMYGDRKATHERPQDDVELEPKHEAKIRNDNANDLKLFLSLSDQLENLEFLKSNPGADTENGHLCAIIDTDKDEIVGVKFEQYGMTPKFNPNMSPEEVRKFEAKNAKDRIDFTNSGVSKEHDMTMNPEELKEFEHSALAFAPPSFKPMGLSA